jgi:hypothetical protein
MQLNEQNLGDFSPDLHPDILPLRQAVSSLRGKDIANSSECSEWMPDNQEELIGYYLSGKLHGFIIPGRPGSRTSAFCFLSTS